APRDLETALRDQLPEPAPLHGQPRAAQEAVNGAEVGAVEPVLDDDLHRGAGGHLETGDERVVLAQLLNCAREVRLHPIGETHEHAAAVHQGGVGADAEAVAADPAQTDAVAVERTDHRLRGQAPPVGEVGAAVRTHGVEYV